MFDLTSHQPQMVVSNFVPASVQRLNGQLYAWSAIWQNTQVTGSSTNQIQFHVLVVDHFLQSAFPSQIYRLSLHAPHLVITDPVSVGQSMVLDARSMDVTGSLTLPSRASWGNTNVVELYSLTNHGVITVSQTALVGTDRPNPYDNYVNLGTNTAATQLIRVNHFENSGSLVASSGLISIGADTTQVSGLPPVTNVTVGFSFTNFNFNLVTNTTIVGAKIQSSSDISIAANELVMSNAVFQTGANGSALEISVNNHLADAGIAAVSTWLAGGPIRMLIQPTNGTLLGTHIVSTVPRNSEVFHVWSAQDRGATSSGFSNNLAVGKFTLDAGDFSIIHFSSSDPGTNKALYVDYLELLNYATNVNTQFAIDPNFTIYFANANLAATKLDGAAGGRLRWVKSFTGPLSSTNFTYTITNLDGTVTSRIYTFNTALVTDKNLNSDGDSLVNGDDPTPIYTAESVGLKIATTRKLFPPQVSITWNALRGVTNTVLYRTNLTLGGWLVLTNVLPPGPFSGPFTAHDLLPAGATGAVERIYRVQVNASP